VGATSADVEREQLSRALELEPDLITLICGANDVLESVRPDAGAYAERLGRMYARLRGEAPAAVLLTATYPDISRFLDLRPRTRARVQKGMRVFNAACRRVAERHGVALLEGFDHPAADDRDTYAEDGFHPSPEGHRRAAAAFLRALRTRLRMTEAPA
jgi:phosphatidylinositol alpha 1,6-mannosyltransferase